MQKAKLRAADKDGLGHLQFQSMGQPSIIFVIINKLNIYITETQTHLTAMVKYTGKHEQQAPEFITGNQSREVWVLPIWHPVDVNTSQGDHIMRGQANPTATRYLKPSLFIICATVKSRGSCQDWHVVKRMNRGLVPYKTNAGSKSSAVVNRSKVHGTSSAALNHSPNCPQL